MPQLNEFCSKCGNNHLVLLNRILSWSKRKDNCLVCYIALDHQGRPKIEIQGKSYFVTRVMYHMFLDFDLDSDLPILHDDNICKSKACIEINHLRIGTASENTRDSISKHGAYTLGKRNKFCKRGHLRTKNNLDQNGSCRLCKMYLLQLKKEKRNATT